MLYVGAGFDCTPIVQFSNVLNFYFFDSQPKYNPTFLKRKSSSNNVKLPNDYFKSTLISQWKQFGIEFVEQKQNKLIFKRYGQQVIHYYINCHVPNDIKDITISKPIRYVFVKGYDPDIGILSLTNYRNHDNNKLIFIGDYNTNYRFAKDNTSLINHLNTDSDQDIFQSFILITKQNKLLYRSNWNDFLLLT
jgi:hypothetical protein